MKKIECIIGAQKLEDVKTALTDLGIVGMTATEVKGFGKQRGFVQHYRTSERLVSFLPKIHVAVVVKDAELDQAVDAIIAAVRTGAVGDGKIFVSTIDEVIRIRTGERGDAAL
jgi:nitrogen regulatory protein P-II 1